MSPIVLFASLALVQQAPPAPSQTSPAVQPDSAPVALETVEVETSARSPVVQVCRTEPVTGSRFGRRVCRSNIETSDERRDSQEMLRRMQGSRMPDGG